MPLPDAPIQTDVAIVEQNGIPQGSESLNNLATSLGMIGIPQNILQSLRDLGAYVEGMGSLKVAQGKAIFTMTAMEPVIAKLQAMAMDENATKKEAQECARTLGYLADKMIKANKVFVEMVPEAKEEAKAENNRRALSWVPGATLGPSVTVNVAPGASITVSDGSTPQPDSKTPQIAS